MYKFAEETTIYALEECYSLCEAHFKELNMEGTFNVDWETLESYLDAGILAVTTARTENEIVGYYMNIITKDFMTSELVAKELSIYVAPAHRGTRLFFKMHEYNTQMLKDRGVQVQYITFMHGHNDRLPLKLGFEPLEITYKKVIGDS